MSRSDLDLTPAKDATLAALMDTRPEVVEAAGNALGWLNANDAQASLLTVASGEKTGDDVKISLYHSLATNAKNFGNHLTADQVAQLDKIVATTTKNDVKSAAAEARGAEPAARSSQDADRQAVPRLIVQYRDHQERLAQRRFFLRDIMSCTCPRFENNPAIRPVRPDTDVPGTVHPRQRILGKLHHRAHPRRCLSHRCRHRAAHCAPASLRYRCDARRDSCHLPYSPGLRSLSPVVDAICGRARDRRLLRHRTRHRTA